MLRKTSLALALAMLSTAKCEQTQTSAKIPTRPIYTMACVSEDVNRVAERLRVQRSKHVTKSYWAEDRHTPRPWLSPVRFERILGTGLRERPECFGEARSIEPAYDGLILLDIESPFWDPLRRPDGYTDEDRDWAAGVFNDVTSELKRVRPQAKVLLHNSIWPNAEPWSRDINSRVHGSTPSMFMKRSPDRRETEEDAMEAAWRVHDKRLQAFLHYKAEHPRFLIFPTVWAMWRDVRVEKVPLNLARIHVRRILAFEHEGQRVDGLFLFSLTRQADGSNDPDHDIAYLKMLAEEIAKVRP